MWVKGWVIPGLHRDPVGLYLYLNQCVNIPCQEDEGHAEGFVFAICMGFFFFFLFCFEVSLHICLGTNCVVPLSKDLCKVVCSYAPFGIGDT